MGWATPSVALEADDGEFTRITRATRTPSQFDKKRIFTRARKREKWQRTPGCSSENHVLPIPTDVCPTM